MSSSTLSQNRALPLLNAAISSHYGIPAICVYNLEGILAIIRAAERKSSPAMILLFPWAITYSSGALVRAAAQLARAAKVPVTVHLDHAQSPQIIRQAMTIEPGFDSIMVDMSHYEREENLRLTAELVSELHGRGIAVEAESGRIEGGEDGVADTVDSKGMLTTVEEAKVFVDTGIDWLAPAFGNVHGNYGPRGVQLEYDRLHAINESVGRDVRLVLHGADPFDEEIFKKCIACGVSKVNVNKAVNQEYTTVQAERSGKAPLTQVIEEATAAMQAAVERIMDLLESTGKADGLKLL
ncbi:hypothetical protein KEM54_000242 [Ascosphaera aggregata]|nr:hypothetical protein KEM54_000242 [Ascosphaera aggregata]